MRERRGKIRIDRDGAFKQLARFEVATSRVAGMRARVRVESRVIGFNVDYCPSGPIGFCSPASA